MSKEKEKLSFVFPDLMAKFMKKVTMRTQLESSLLSMSMILTGMTIMAVYLIIYGEMGIFYKCLVLFNLACGFLFISSFLVTTYQQYISYMNMAGIDPDKHREEILKRGNIFKRIYLAIKDKKERKKQNKQPLIVKEAIENMIKIKTEELKDTQKLQEEADRLRKEVNDNTIKRR